MSIYLTSFYPLTYTGHGSRAIKEYGLSPWIDGSCRRIPDFEHDLPAITGLCRPGFSKKLEKEDKIIYLTNRKGVDGKFLIAILKVEEEPIIGHYKAAKRYREKGYINLPNDIMVPATKPFPLEKTHNMGRWGRWVNGTTVDDWNADYLQRSQDYPHVAICSIEHGPFLEKPRLVTTADFKYIFRRIPGTRNPPQLRPGEWERFQERILSKLY